MSDSNFTIELAGDVVERQELLNGTSIVTLEGASADGAWTVVAGLSWSIGPAGAATEGDITLTRDDGELFATLAQGDVREAPASDDASHLLALGYEIDGGSAAFRGATGHLRAQGHLVRDAFRVEVVVTISNT